MKKFILLVLAIFLLAVPVNAKKPKLARSVWFLFEKQDNLDKQPNDSVVVSYKTEIKGLAPNDPNRSAWNPQPTIIMTIHNKSERIIYVDLQKSFAVINEELYPLYVHTSEVQTTSNTSMVGVNLGLVGIGSAGTTSNAKITHAERYIIVPGETKKSIEIPLTKWEKSFVLNNVDGIIELRPAEYMAIKDPNIQWYIRLLQYFINYGEVKNYDYDDNPLTLDMRVCYSFDDSMTPNYTNRSVYYAAHIVGSDYVTGGGGQYINELAIERALEIYPPLNDYLTSPKKLYFHLWTPHPIPKK